MVRRAAPAVDAEKEAEPILAVFAESGPANGAAQLQFLALDARFFVNLAAHARDHVLAGIELAAEAVVFPQMRIVGPAIAMDEQDAAAIGGHDVTERGEDWSVRHGGSMHELARV